MNFFGGSFFGSGFFGSQTVQVGVILSGGGDWRDFVTEKSQRHVKLAVRTEERKLKKVEKKIANAYKRVVVEKSEGILLNLHRLETKRTEIIARIQELKIEFNPPEFEDEEDIEVLLLDS
jgi:glutamate synthase domain-containing protein 3